MNFKEQSYYDMLEVAPNAGARDLSKGYKRKSLELHPDKQHAAGNAGEDEDGGSAEDAFIALKAAYDILSNTAERELYDKFGKPGLDYKDDTTNLIQGLGFFYVMWLAIAYLLTRRKAYGRAQTWCFTGLMALAIFEYQATILSFDFLEDALPQLVLQEMQEIHVPGLLYPIMVEVKDSPIRIFGPSV